MWKTTKVQGITVLIIEQKSGSQSSENDREGETLPFKFMSSEQRQTNRF